MYNINNLGTKSTKMKKKPALYTRLKIGREGSKQIDLKSNGNILPNRS